MDKSEDSRIASLCFNAGIRFLNSHDYLAAKDALKNATVLDPSNSTAFSRFRTAAVAFGRYGLKMKMFQGRVVPLSPKAVCPFALGLSHLLDGDFSSSMRYISQALILEYPNDELKFYFQSAACGFGRMALELETNNERATQLPLAPPPPPPKEPTLTCPICMAPFVEEMSTKCGHIFCNKCIKAAITAHGKCPTCRRKVTAEELLRVM